MLSYIFLSEAQKAMDCKDWTRKKLASEIGTSASYLTQLFRGDRLLNLKTIAKIESALDIRYSIITGPGYGGESEKSFRLQSRQKKELEQSQVNEP